MDNDPKDNEPNGGPAVGDPDDHGLPHWTEPGTGEVPKATTIWPRGPR